MRQKIFNVAIFEYQDIKYASRARKEAFTLAKSGYSVTLIGFNSSISKIKMEEIEGVKILQYPYYKLFDWGQKVFNVLILNIKILFHFTKKKYDIYHLHNLKVFFPAVVVKILTQKPLIYDAHELNIGKRKKKNFRNCFYAQIDKIEEKILNKFSDVIIQASTERARFYRQYYKIKQPIILNNYTNIEKKFTQSVNLRQSLKINDKNILIVFTGNISIGGSQNIINVIKALKYTSNVDLCLLGSLNGKIKNEIDDLANSLKVNKHIRFHPPVLAEEVVSTMATADLAIVPVDASCLNTKYSALNKLSQALMAGLPILGSNSEVIIKTILLNPVGIVGDVFDITNPKSIADSIERILSSNLELMKINARNLALSLMNWEAESIKLLKVYSKLKKY